MTKIIKEEIQNTFNEDTIYEMNEDSVKIQNVIEVYDEDNQSEN